MQYVNAISAITMDKNAQKGGLIAADWKKI